MTQEEKKGVGDAGKLAGKLTDDKSAIFNHDLNTYYVEGKDFPELNGIRDRKLVEELLKKNSEKNPSDNNKKLTEGEKALIQAKKIITDAKESLHLEEKAAKDPSAKKPKKAEIPLARIVEAANQYFDVGNYENGNTLLKYAIQQAKIIEKDKSTGEKAITNQLEEYKAEVDKFYEKTGKEESNYKGTAIDKKLESLIAAAEKVELGKGTANIPTLKASQISLG